MFRASSLTQVLARLAKALGSIILPTNGEHTPKFKVVKSNGKLITKNENLTPLGMLVSFIENSSSRVCSCTYLSLANFIS